MDHPSGVISKKSSPYSRSCIFSLMLVSRNFIVLPFTFRSMIHFELTFMKGVMSMSKFLFIYLFLHEHVQLFQHYLLKRLYFFIVFPLLLFQRTIDYIYVDISRLWGFPGGSVVKNSPVNAGDARDVGSIPGSGRSLGVGNGNLPIFLPGKCHGQRSLADYSPWGHKESDSTSD